MMLGIAFSLFIRTHLPWSRKLILCCIFGLGIFVVLSAVLNKYYSFTHPFGSQWTFWYVRESSTTLLVANIPFTWTILRRIFRLPEFHELKSAKKVKYHSQRSARGRHRPSNRNSGSRTGTTQYYSQSGGGTALTSKIGPGSQSGSNEITLQPPSPVSIRHPSLLVERPAPTSWRDRGFYGRAELDALSMGPDEDDDEGDELPTIDTRTIRSQGTNHSDHPSPTSSRSRKLRDEEAQYEMQENISPKYHEFTFNDDDHDNSGPADQNREAENTARRSL
jgi:hypothetical protein